jgi:hypothetical protein
MPSVLLIAPLDTKGADAAARPLIGLMQDVRTPREAHGHCPTKAI